MRPHGPDMSERTPRRMTADERAQSEHKHALDDLQDAVHGTMGPREEREAQLANLRRASRRESEARDALFGRERQR